MTYLSQASIDVLAERQFQEGQLIKSIFWEEESFLEVGKHRCKRITVVMENGQMDGVPWFLVEFEDKPPQTFNAAMTEGVMLYASLDRGGG